MLLSLTPAPEQTAATERLRRCAAGSVGGWKRTAETGFGRSPDADENLPSRLHVFGLGVHPQRGVHPPPSLLELAAVVAHYQSNGARGCGRSALFVRSRLKHGH